MCELQFLRKWLYHIFKHDKSSTEEEMKVEKLRHELHEKEKVIGRLQAQLDQAQSEQASQVGMSHLIIIRLTNH